MKNHYLLLTQSLLVLFFIGFTSCGTEDMDIQGADAKAINKTAEAKGKAPAQEIVGNNLSFPVIFSDGVAKSLPGTFGEESFSGLFFTASDSEGDSYDYYIQGEPGNTWQAETFDPTKGEPGPIGNSEVNVSSIDWGDNLEAKDWPFGAQIRVEVVLYKRLLSPMLGYEMKIEDESQSGLTEVWGAKTVEDQGETVGVTYQIDSATVYSGMAKLIIQKLDDVPEGQTPNVTWNSNLSYWEGDIGAPLFAGGVWEGTDGPSGYSAEINVQGKIIYGYNWVTRKTGDGSGTYRLTFALDNNFNGTKNTLFDANTKIVGSVEEEEVVITEEPELGGGTAVILYQENLSYIDVHLIAKNGQGGGNSGQGGGNSGSHGNSGSSGNGPNH